MPRIRTSSSAGKRAGKRASPSLRPSGSVAGSSQRAARMSVSQCSPPWRSSCSSTPWTSSSAQRVPTRTAAPPGSRRVMRSCFHHETSFSSAVLLEAVSFPAITSSPTMSWAPRPTMDEPAPAAINPPPWTRSHLSIALESDRSFTPNRGPYSMIRSRILRENISARLAVAHARITRCSGCVSK